MFDFVEKIIQKINHEISDIENRADITEDQKVLLIIKNISFICSAEVAVVPIPFADIFILTPIQIYMGKKISNIRRYNVSENEIRTIVKEIFGIVGMGILAQQSIIGLYKTIIPFAGGATTMPLVFGFTFAIGKTIDFYINKKMKNEKIAFNEIKNIYKKFFKLGKKKERKHDEYRL